VPDAVVSLSNPTESRAATISPPPVLTGPELLPAPASPLLPAAPGLGPAVPLPALAAPELPWPTAARRVIGRVSHRDTRLPLSDVVIEAFDAGSVGERALGRSTTDQHGRYEMAYTVLDLAEGEAGVSLAIRAMLPGGAVLATSEVQHNAPTNSVIDLVLDATSSGAAEYQRLLADLELPGVELPHQPELVELLREATRRSGETGIPAELLYALGRESLPLDPTALLSRDPGELPSALEGAARRGILSMPALAAAAELDRRLPQLTARYTELARMGDAAGVAIPPQLVSALAARGIRTLADIQTSGGLRGVEALPLPPDDPAVVALEAYANLSALPIGLTTSRRLIDAGYRHILDVAETPPDTFAQSLSGGLSREDALAIHEAAAARAGVLANVITGARNGNGGDEGFAAKLISVTPPVCGCKSCINATGPLVYLADLLDYAVRHVRYNGAPITVSWLARRFHQPFDRLPAACEWVDRRIPQIRIAIEVLRAELQSASATPAYLSFTYELLLQGIGTSLEELRGLMMAGPNAKRRTLAERLGIVLTPAGPGGTDELDELYAHGQHPPSEATLEMLFGLRDTNRDPLAPDVRPAVLAWRTEYLNRVWSREDWPQNAPAATPALIDPDLVGQADIAETSPYIAPNRATDFRQRRESDLNTYRTELVQFLTGPTPGALDLLLRNRDQAGHVLIPPWGLEKSVADIVAIGAKAAGGIDIGPDVTALELSRPAFDVIAAVAVAYQANPAGVTDEAMGAVSDILIQRYKERQLNRAWRTEEENARIALTPDHFRLRASPLSGGALEWKPRPWRSTLEQRRKWEDTLRARVAQLAAAVESLKTAVRETEEAVLAQLRQSLCFLAQTRMPGVSLAQTLDRLTQNLGIDVEAGTCQKTTRVAQAIETIQVLLFGARNGLLEDPGITLDAPFFDIEWQWIGSFATHRAAIQVFLYPENALRPTLRRRQTKPFATLVNHLRQQGQVDGPSVQKELREYQEYFADICSLWPAGMGVTEGLRTDDPFDPASIPLSSLTGPPDWFERARVLAVAKGGDTGRYYFSTWKTRPGWGFSGSPSQSLWEEIPGLRGAADLMSVLSFQSGSNDTGVAVQLRGSVTSGGRFLVSTYDGSQWNDPIGLDRLPGFLTTSRYSSDSLPPDPDLAEGAPRPSWQLQAGDQVVTADVDGDGRAEVIVLSGGLVNGVRRAAVLRQRDGGLVVAWAGPLDSDWVLTNPSRPIRLLKSDNTYIARPYRTRVLVTNPARSKVGVLGYTDGQGLSVLWQSIQVTGASGAWTVAAPAPPSGFANEIIGSDPVPPGGQVFVFEYTPGTTGMFQAVNLSVVALRSSGDSLSFLGRQAAGFARLDYQESPWTNLHPMPNGDIGAVSWSRTRHVTATDIYFELRVSYSMLYWSAAGQLTPRWTVNSGTGAHLNDPPIFLNDVNGKPSTWQLRPDDRYYAVVGTFQQRVVLLNVQRRAAALLMDRRVVWQTDGQFEAEEGRDGDVWPIQDGDSILAAFTDEQGTPLLFFSNPGFGRLGLVAVIGDRLRTRWMASGRIPAPGAQAGQGWAVRPTARFAFGDLDMDLNRELITITPAEGGTGELALLHLLPGPVSRGLSLKTGMPSRHGLSGIPSELIRLDYPPRPSASALADRRARSKTAYEQTIASGNERALIYLDEALYFMPVEIALRLSSSSRYSLALDCFRAVYEYDRPGGPLPVINKLVLDGVGVSSFDRELDWLRDPLDPHAIAETRRGSYLKFTLLSVIQCLLLAADAEFARATAESIPRARELYLEALELLGAQLLTAGVPSCESIIGALEVQIGDYDDAWVWHDIQLRLLAIRDYADLSKTVKAIGGVLAGDQPVRDRLAAVVAMIEEVRAAARGHRNGRTVVGLARDSRSYARKAMNAALASPVASRWINDVSRFRGGIYSLDQIPAPMFGVCVPPNPIVEVFRRHASTNLQKIRSCRSIAGLEMEVEPYAAPTGTVGPDEVVDAVRQLQGRPALQPLPYRYSTLVERARQLVEICRQIEASMLSALESRDRTAYDEIKARQDLALTQAGVQLRDLQLNQANDGVVTATLQRGRAELQATHFRSLIDFGLTPNEQAAMAAHLTATSLQTIPVLGGSVGSGAAGLAQHYATAASYERREQEWQAQEALAQQDVRIGDQQINQARDTAQIAAQERLIAGMQAEHAETLLDFIATKRFGNADLYDWMSGILEQIYRFFLQQATSMAQLAEAQLAFERQETLPVFIQADYWEPARASLDAGEGDPVAAAIAAAIAASGQASDRRGLTGSVRLLRDLTELDQYAFRTNQRKLQLSKTLSLAQLDPIAFQRFRETGVLRFATPLSLFDRDFPGHYLRLIRRVRTSVIALIPPTEGIHATLGTTGPTRVVVAGSDFPTSVVRRGPESVSLTSPMNATGLFELDAQPEMLVPFEFLGVDAMWEFRLAKPANRIDYDTVADVLFAVDYTALDSSEYREQVLNRLERRTGADRPFSFRQDFADAWYDLHNPDQTPTPMTVTFETRSGDFPPNIENLRIDQVVFYVARRGGATFEVPVTRLRFTPEGGAPVEGGNSTTDGIISTRRANGAPWRSMVGKPVVGQWELELPNTPAVRGRFDRDEVVEILLVLTFSGEVPAWPA
jgi:hypothetical protein